MSKPGNTVKKKLIPVKTANPDAGAKYEISVATLVAAILTNKEEIENYHVFTNLKEAHPFDDVVAKVLFKGDSVPYVFAMQLKHIGKGETLDVKKYIKGYNKILNAGGFQTIGNISVDNIHFCYFCINKVQEADNYTLCKHNAPSKSWMSALSFSNPHTLSYNEPINDTDKDFLDNFPLYLYQPDNNKIKEEIKSLCKMKDVSGILNYVDRFFEKGELWKKGLCKEVFETELLRIRLSDHMIPPADIVQLHESQVAMWNELTLQHNITLVESEPNIEKSLYGCFVQTLNRIFNNIIDWNTCKTSDLDSSIINRFKELSKVDQAEKPRYWIDPPTTLKSLLVELWKCGKLPLILRSSEEVSVLKDYRHLNKNYIVVTENLLNNREEYDRCQLTVFMNMGDIKYLKLRDAFLKTILVSIQGRTPITLHSVVQSNEELTKTLSCSDIIHLMKAREAYLSKECVNGDNNMIFLIEDPNSTAEYNIDNINKIGGNIGIRCRSENIMRYHKQINENPKLQAYKIYHCTTTSENGNFTLLEGDKFLLRDFFVDQDGEDVYVLGNHPVPIVGPSLKYIQPNYISRFVYSALVSPSLFDSQKKGICFFSGDINHLEKEIRTHLVEPPKDIKFNNENVFISVRDEDLDKYWKIASNLKCPLLHIRVEGTHMQLSRCKNWESLSDHILFSGRKISEERVLTEATDGITILTGEPGIGKSSLLQSIFKNHGMEKYILFYNLVDYSRFLEEQTLVATNISLNLLLDGFKDKRYEKFLSALFKRQDRVLVLLDSFDEVLPISKKNVLHFIGNLAASNIQIIIASRTIANYILLGSFETKILKVGSLEEYDRNKYIKNYKLSKDVLMNVPEEFLQNPLYLNLLKTMSENNINLERFNKLSLFRKVVEIKLEQYFQKYFAKEHTHSKEHHLEPVRELHFQLALIRILGMGTAKELLQLEKKIELTNELKLGIVVSIDERGSSTFVHETFAEYLIADWIIRNKTKDSAKKIYLEMKVQNKLYILDILCEHLQLHKAILAQNRAQIRMYARNRVHLEETDDLGRMAIHVAAAYQPTALWFAIEIIIDNMRKFNVDFTRSDVLMQWNWAEHLCYSNIINFMLFDEISMIVWEAYFNCMAQKLRIKGKLSIEHLSDQEHTKMYDVAMIACSINMIRDLLFIEDVKHNGLLPALEVGTLHLRSIRKLTALHVACIYGNVQTLRKLISGKNKNARDSFGCTSLHYCVMNPSEVYTDMVKTLLEKRSKVNVKNHYGETPIHIALRSGNLKIVKLLLQKGTHFKGIRKDMPKLLSLAVDTEDLGIIELLLKKYKLDSSILSDTLLYASSKSNSDVVRLLLEKGADVNSMREWDGTALTMAIETGNLEAVKVLVESGANVNGTSSFGQTPLMFASERGDLDTVKILLENGANVNSTTTMDETTFALVSEIDVDKYVRCVLLDTYGKTPLITACKYGNLEVAKKLLEKGASVNSTTGDGKTPFIYACENGNLDIAKILLEKGASINSTTADGKTSLTYACKNSKLDIAKMLLEKCASVNTATADGETSLIYACKNGKLDIAKILLEKGASVNTTTADGKTPLMFASEKGYLDIVEVLLEKGADVNSIGPYKQTPLTLAFEWNNLDIIKTLLEKDASVNVATIYGNTPLMFASEWGNIDILNILLEKGADVNSTNLCDQTPLILAFEHNTLDIVKVLLEKGASVNSAATDGKTPLMFASEWNYLDVARTLLEKGASVNSTTIDDKKTPLMFASEWNNLDILKILLEKGASVNSTDIHNQTPLVLASERGNFDIVKILLEKGATVNIAREDGKTPLMFATEWNNSDTVKILLEKGASINVAKSDGKTPLTFASKWSGLDIINVLLEKGANVNCTTIDGKTPLAFAYERGDKDVIDVLLRFGASRTSSIQPKQRRFGVSRARWLQGLVRTKNE